MTRSSAIALAILLSIPALAETRDGDPIAVLMNRVVAAMGRDDISAFDPLVVSEGEFDWANLAEPLVDRYQCPAIERWSFTFLDRASDRARVKLEIDGSALLASRGTLARLPRFWVLDLRTIEGHWRVQAFVTLERDVARRVMQARPEGRLALFNADPDADPAEVIRNIADCSGLELSNYSKSLKPPRERPAVIAEIHALADFNRERARARNSLAAEGVAVAQEAAALRLLGLRAEALAVAEEALDLAGRSGDPDALASAYFARGIGRWQNGDSAHALEDLAASGRLLHDAVNVVMPLHSLAMEVALANFATDYRSLILRATTLTEAAHDTGWTEGESFAEFTLADMHYSLRNFDVSREGYEKAFLLARRIHVRFAPMAEVGMALCDLALGHAVRSEREILESGWLREEAALPYVVFGSALMARNKLEEASRILNKAVARGRKESNSQIASDACTTLAQLRLMQNRPSAALAMAEEALQRGLDGSAPLFDWSPWRAQAMVARALRRLGRQREARVALTNAIVLVEQLRTSMVSDPTAARYFEDKGDLYDDLIGADVDLGDVRGALAVAEQLRARTIRDVLSQTGSDRDASLTAEEREREEGAAKHLEALNRKVLATSSAHDAALLAQRDGARLELDRITDELMAVHPELRAHRAGFRPILSLPPLLASTAVVEYVVADEATYIFTITREGDRTGVAVKRIDISRRALTQLVERLNARIAQRDIRYRATASRLHELLLAPVWRTIASRTDLCIVPDGPLWALPFQVLTDASGADLVSKRAVFYSPALTLLTMTPPHRGTADRRTLVAFANPHAGGDAVTHMRALFRGAELGALPEAETEALRIAAIYGKEQSQVFIGANARESTFKRTAGSARILHVATHGVIDDRAPLYSALLLAPDDPDGDDGLLEAREVLDLHLDADLAVLSACDTARGRIGAGEGVIGLSWAFLAAGCRTLVVSQSPAETKATEELMVEFHRQLSRGVSIAEALRQAQLALRTQPRFAHPFYWAPFVAIGQGYSPLRR
jgi:CHAT domain-containing protein